MKDNNCIFNLLKVIDLLQRNSTNHESFATGCDKPYLGPACTTICFNTRPISLYKKMALYLVLMIIVFLEWNM